MFTKFDIKNKLNRFVYSDWFIGLIALSVFLSWGLECEYIAAVVFVFFAAYILLTQPYLDRLIPMLIMFPAVVYKELRNRLYDYKIILGVVVAVFLIACFIYHFARVHKKNGRKLKCSKVIIGYLIAMVAICIGGLFYPAQKFLYVVYAFAISGGFVLIYIMLFKCTNSDCKNVILKSIIALCYVIVFQMTFYFVAIDDLLLAIASKEMSLGWAITNSVAQMLAFGIPLCFYFAFKGKNQIFWYITSFIFFAFIFLTNCRSMMVAGILIYFVCVVIATIKFPSFKLLGCVAVFGLISVIIFEKYYDVLFSYFLSDGLSSYGRNLLYPHFIEKFKENPVLGIGFFTDNTFSSDSVVRCHNSLLQILASMGVVGLVLFIPYYFQRYKVLVTKFSTFKMFAIIAYFSYAFYGMLDCAIISFYKNILVFLLIFICEMEINPEPVISKIKSKKELKNVIASSNNDQKSIVVDASPTITTMGSANKKLSRSFYRCFFKRFLDIVISFIAIVLLSPLLLCLSILVLCFSGWPLIFSQYRVGKDGKIFKFIKFRSMSNKRDANGELLPDKQRLGKFGKFIRKTSLDELAQLFIILSGKMSLVGPRPRDVKECVFLDEIQYHRHDVKPGITGLAQVNGRNGLTLNQVAEYDLQYVEKMSLWLDIKILFKTIVCVFRKSNIDGTVEANNQNEYHGDYLLRTKKIDKDYYDKKLDEAKFLIQQMENKKS